MQATLQRNLGHRPLLVHTRLTPSAEAALQRARDRLKNPEDATDVDRALEALKRSTMRLETARGNTREN